ncbi:MAG: hypothetical protein PHX43_04055, partial [Alphaproteobacteria bacterium]|nr:hypothetical protein [Alphaproteobacteria bacterium]
MIRFPKIICASLCTIVLVLVGGGVAFASSSTITASEKVRVGGLVFTNTTYSDGSNRVERDVCATDDAMIREIRQDQNSKDYYQFIYSDGSYCLTNKKSLPSSPAVSSTPVDSKNPEATPMIGIEPKSIETVKIGGLVFTNYTYPDGSNRMERDICATDDIMLVDVRKDTQTEGYYQFIYSDGSWCISNKKEIPSKFKKTGAAEYGPVQDFIFNYGSDSDPDEVHEQGYESPFYSSGGGSTAHGGSGGTGWTGGTGAAVNGFAPPSEAWCLVGFAYGDKGLFGKGHPGIDLKAT